MSFTLMPFAAALSGCGPTAQDKIAEQAEIQASRMKIEYLQRQMDAMSDGTPPRTAVAEPAQEHRSRIQRKATQGWCYKDYCPCEPNPDNNAGDRLNCDLMESGQQVDDKMLALARGNREVRRMLRTEN